MHMIGPSNWWLPDWLDHVLPHVTMEARDDLVSHRNTG